MISWLFVTATVLLADGIIDFVLRHVDVRVMTPWRTWTFAYTSPGEAVDYYAPRLVRAIAKFKQEHASTASLPQTRIDLNSRFWRDIDESLAKW